MKNFLTGLGIGVPVGMLLADVIAPERSEMAERMREIWTEARARAAQVTSGSVAREEGQSTRDLLDREASESRERASSATESDMEERRRAVLNQVTREELLAVYGIGPVLADRIIAGRPYASDEDVIERGILHDSTFDQLRRQLLDRYRKSA